jgi:hypothetical protein
MEKEVFPMRTIKVTAVFVGDVIAVTAALAGCSSGSLHSSASHTHVAATASATASTPAQAVSTPDTGTTDGSLLSCTTVVEPDPGEVGLNATGSLITEQVIAFLSAAMLTGAGGLISGNPSQTTLTVLTAGIQDLENYNGGQLAADASQFVQDAESYTGFPDNNGQIDPSYLKAMTSDITTLVKACPGEGKYVNALLAGKRI